MINFVSFSVNFVAIGSQIKIIVIYGLQVNDILQYQK